MLGKADGMPKVWINQAFFSHDTMVPLSNAATENKDEEKKSVQIQRRRIIQIFFSDGKKTACMYQIYTDAAHTSKVHTLTHVQLKGGGESSKFNKYLKDVKHINYFAFVARVVPIWLQADKDKKYSISWRGEREKLR